MTTKMKAMLDAIPNAWVRVVDVLGSKSRHTLNALVRSGRVEYAVVNGRRYVRRSQ